MIGLLDRAVGITGMCHRQQHTENRGTRVALLRRPCIILVLAPTRSMIIDIHQDREIALMIVIAMIVSVMIAVIDISGIAIMSLLGKDHRRMGSIFATMHRPA